MDSTMQAVLQFVEENDVKFIRLAFCDVMGTLKNIAIMPSPNTIIMPPAWYSPRKLPASPPMMSTGCFSRYAFIWMPAR